MIRRFLKSKWWNLTAAITSLATAGYAVYMATEHHVLMVWILMASMFMTGYETWMFISRRKEAKW